MENLKKKELQFKLANYFLKHSRSTFILPTGTSKTRIGVILIKYLVDNFNITNIPIITPTEIIRDDTWVEEITKWAGVEYLKHVNIQCIQAIYQMKGHDFPFVIADEVHNYFPNHDDYKSKAREYVKFFTENKIERLLGLSASIPPRKRTTCAAIAPITFEMSVDDAVDAGYISNFMIYNVPVPLSVNEMISYKVIQDGIELYTKYLGGAYMAYSNAQSILKQAKVSNIAAASQEKRVLFGRAKKYMKLISERQAFLHTNTAKVEACNKIVDIYKDKVFVFSASKTFADIFGEQRSDTVIVHSGITKSKRLKSIIAFKDYDEIHAISTVNVLNEGVNIPKTKLGILAGGNSTRKDLTQRLGRTLRITDDGRAAQFIQLYNPDTQDEKWTNSRIEGINTSRITRVSGIDEMLMLLNIKQ